MNLITNFLKRSLLILIVIFPFCSFSQTINSATEYLDFIGIQHRSIMENVWDYTSSVSHGKSARKVEKRRKEVIQSIEDAQKSIAKLKPFNNDASLRDSVLSYLEISHVVLSENYGKIVDMEVIAEQSYDAMEAYLMAQEIANQKLDEVEQMMINEHRSFAAANNITIIENNDPLTKKMQKAGEVIKYYNTIFLLFFKSNKQEAYLIEALSKSDLNAIEQNRSTLEKYANEGLANIDTIKSFSGDLSMVAATKQFLKFYKDESENKIKGMTNFFMEKEKFEKIKAAFDAKSKNAKTQKDYDQFNDAVNSVNKASADYNAINNELNNNRQKYNDNWNKVATAFLDKHVPKKK